jgi:16S rRNA (cytosine1402-N4)-methyltransferase
MKKNSQEMSHNEATLFYHKPVLVSQVIEYLDPKPRKIYLDVTFGSGGHTQAILDAEPKCEVVAMDWDKVSLETYGEPLLDKYGDRLRLIWTNFSLIYKILRKEKIKGLDGILADFGPSQIQLTQRQGFSFYHDTPLDMRMSPAHQPITAEYVIAKSSEEKLREIFWQLGEETYAKEIARAILKERTKYSRNCIKTTGHLAKIVESVVPAQRGRRTHPATKVFQALRIYVNHELENIASLLPVAFSSLNNKARLVCISFHSLEDRLVKNFFREKEQEGVAELLTPKVVLGTKEEIKENPSARSAKLRAVERIIL